MNLLEAREQIDKVDDIIMDKIFERLLLSIHIGVVKKENNIAVYDSGREDEIYRNIAEKIQVLTENRCMDIDNQILKESFETIFQLILDQSKKIQREI